jgi:predicted permease
MQTLWQDLRYGARILLKNPGFTLIAVVTLALGMGINTSVFSLVNAILLRPLSTIEPDTLVRLYDGRAISYPAYADYRDQCAAFAGLAAYAPRTMGLQRGEQSEALAAEVVTGNYFDVLGMRPVVGRGFLPPEDQASATPPVVVLSYGLWLRLFNAAPEAVGQPLVLNGQDFTVIGVAPQDFTSANTGFAPALWVTVRQYAQLSNRGLAEQRAERWLSMIGRLKPGVSLAQGEAAAKLTAQHLAQASPNTSNDAGPDGQSIRLFPAKGLAVPPGEQMTVTFAVGLLTAIAGLILLIACANVTSMLLARASTRRKEIAIRLALGSTRWRLMRQLLTESLMLALLGGALGLLLALWVPDLWLALIPADYHVPVLDTRLDKRVFGFTFGLSLLTSALFGLAPTLQSSKPDLVAALKDEAARGMRSHTRISLRSSLVVAQVAISLVLLIVAGLFVRNFRRALIAEPGFAANEVLAVTLDLKLSGYDVNRSQAFYDELQQRIAALPQVRAVSLAKFAPLTGGRNRRRLLVEGYASRLGEEVILDSNAVSPGYFQTMGIPVIRGREFNARDTENHSTAVIINEALAHQYWPAQDAVGKRIRLGEDAPALEVVGVVKNSKYLRPEETTVPFLYEPLKQASDTDLTLLVRVTGDSRQAISEVAQTVRALDKSLPVFPQALSAQLSVATAPARMSALLAGIFGLLALALTIVGVYGLMAYVVSQRTHEIGIRLALGAQTSDILKLVIGNGLWLILIGIGIGLVAASFLTRVMAAFLFGVSATDADTFGVVTAILLVTGVIACYLPARRATKVDPMIALRCD